MRWTTLLTLAAFFIHRCLAIQAWDTVVFFRSKPVRSTFRGSVSYPRPMESRTLRFSSAATPAKPTRTLALPYHPQDSFSRIQTTKYQQLIPDLFDFETWDLYRFFTNTPMETSDPASIREMSEAANNFGSPAE